MKNPEFIKKMPSLYQSAKMPDYEVYKSLSIIPSSDFYRKCPQEIAQSISHYEAVRHLNDLILLNEISC